MGHISTRMMRDRFWLENQDFGVSVGVIGIIFRDLSVATGPVTRNRLVRKANLRNRWPTNNSFFKIWLQTTSEASWPRHATKFVFYIGLTWGPYGLARACRPIFQKLPVMSAGVTLSIQQIQLSKTSSSESESADFKIR